MWNTDAYFSSRLYLLCIDMRVSEENVSLTATLCIYVCLHVCAYVYKEFPSSFSLYLLEYFLLKLIIKGSL